MNQESYFPIVVQYTDDGEVVRIKSPAYLDGGRPFKVLETNVFMWERVLSGDVA